MDIENLRWWGWGTLDEGYSLEGRPDFWPTLQQWLALPDGALEEPVSPVALEDISLPPSRLDNPNLSSLCELLGEGAVRVDRRSRVEHAYGKSYRDLVRVRAGYIPAPPDVVVYPDGEAGVVALLSWAAERDVAVIPFGGGSSVVGGVEPSHHGAPTITLDLARLDQVLSVDRESHLAQVQAGARGPEIEGQLEEKGFTLGHFPQSFQFSTLGGWIAARAAGQTSIGYGKIEDMTQALRVVTPAGIVETKDVPATATGPSVREMMIGSEGIYGVITEATMCIHPQPDVQDYRGILFRAFEEGIAAFRDLMQSDSLRPSIVRLSDQPETAAYAALTHEHSGLRRLLDHAVEWYLTVRGYAPVSDCSLMLLGFDGNREWVSQQWSLALDICRAHGGLPVGRSVGQSWKRERYAQPYLRDTLLGHRILVDTLETAANWSNLTSVYRAMVGALKGAITANGGGPGYVMTHVSHAYQQGASLYSTFLGRQIPTSDPLVQQAQWEGIKEAVTEAILNAGGTLSHHHGVGRDHAPWLAEEVGQTGVKTLQSVKQCLDPDGIMNPGVLLSG
ncbi:MAG: FAD-binding oxidoreductase [Chloroflexota bacterium]|nr:FAD-binding oxidoreductase [Chloroflexota bacterium]